MSTPSSSTCIYGGSCPASEAFRRAGSHLVTSGALPNSLSLLRVTNAVYSHERTATLGAHAWGLHARTGCPDLVLAQHEVGHVNCLLATLWISVWTSCQPEP